MAVRQARGPLLVACKAPVVACKSRRGVGAALSRSCLRAAHHDARARPGRLWRPCSWTGPSPSGSRGAELCVKNFSERLSNSKVVHV